MKQTMSNLWTNINLLCIALFYGCTSAQFWIY